MSKFEDDLRRHPDGTVIHDPKNEIHIDEVWAVLSVDSSDNTEGIVSVPTPAGPMPLLAADKKRLEMIVPMARRIKQYTHKKLILVRFSNREDVEVL